MKRFGLATVVVSAVGWAAAMGCGESADHRADDESSELRRRCASRRWMCMDASPAADAASGSDAGVVRPPPSPVDGGALPPTPPGPSGDPGLGLPPPPPLPTTAGCTGSGLTWTCGPGSTSAQVQAVVNAASDGAIVYFAPGAYRWSSSIHLSNAKGVTLACATLHACDVVGAPPVFELTISGTNPHFYRIAGFAISHATSAYVIAFWGSGTLSRFRIDHNRFHDLPSSIAILFGDTASVGRYYGLVDHNTATGADNYTFVHWIGKEDANPPASPKGTANNLFVEDNTITFDAVTNAGAGCSDSWGGASVVWRHNATTNCLVATHGVVHAGGPYNWELYGNTMKVDQGAVGSGVEDGYRLFHHQGSGEFIAFDNRFTAYSGKTGSALEMTHYRSATPASAGYSSSLGRCDGTNPLDGNRVPQATYGGYPCWRQPGRDGAGHLHPMYAWNNRWSDTSAKIDLEVSNPWGAINPGVETHIVAERDYYNAVSGAAQTSPTSPFDGSKGMGFGTLANRPASCTTNASEAGGGVGYFATDDGPHGTLYRCAGPSTWVVQYRPYTYPHPLQAP